jgi:hypothetical protein
MVQHSNSGTSSYSAATYLYCTVQGDFVEGLGPGEEVCGGIVSTFSTLSLVDERTRK